MKRSSPWTSRRPPFQDEAGPAAGGRRSNRLRDQQHALCDPLLTLLSPAFDLLFAPLIPHPPAPREWNGHVSYSESRRGSCLFDSVSGAESELRSLLSSQSLMLTRGRSPASTKSPCSESRVSFLANEEKNDIHECFTVTLNIMYYLMIAVLMKSCTVACGAQSILFCACTRRALEFSDIKL